VDTKLPDDLEVSVASEAFLESDDLLLLFILDLGVITNMASVLSPRDALSNRDDLEVSEDRKVDLGDELRVEGLPCTESGLWG
jgi:hypothetical protein